MHVCVNTYTGMNKYMSTCTDVRTYMFLFLWMKVYMFMCVCPMQGLRTLELCVDNLQPDFLYEHIQPVRAELMQVSVVEGEGCGR